MTRQVILSVFLLSYIVAGQSHAVLTPYFEDFESLDINDLNALSPGPLGDPNNWEFFNSVIGLYDYTGLAPNIQTGAGAPRISSVLNEHGGKYLNVFSDYENRDAHPLPPPDPPPAGVPVVVNVWRLQRFGPVDLGTTWNLDFDYAGAVEGGTNFAPEGSTTTAAFIRVFDFGCNFLGGAELDTTGAGLVTTSGFVPGTVSQFIDPAWTEGFVQFGFTNTASNFEGSGVYYDNVRIAPIPEPSAFLFLAVVFTGLGALSRYRRRKA